MTQRRVRLLDVDKIVDTAIVLINEKGRFTMPELATRLGVSISSIYHHISGRGELVDRIQVIEIAAEIGRSGVPAALLGSFEDRIAAARFSEVDRRTLGEDKVRVLEREPENLQAFPAR